jgi:serine/threonine-protein kinase
MSPEQIKNAKDVDARADLWSAGVMLYEMLTGRVAFPAPTEYARLAAVLNTSPPPLEAFDPNLSRLSAFVQLAMQKDRAQRFQTGLEMARALSAALGAEAKASLPLSRLPDVPSMFAPVRPSTHPPSAAAPLTAHHAAPHTTASGPPVETNIGPGGTLASQHGRVVLGEPALQVIMVGASQSTLPSENLPMFSAQGASGRRGVPPWLVGMLVTAGVIAGFLAGFFVARAH